MPRPPPRLPLVAPSPVVLFQPRRRFALPAAFLRPVLTTGGAGARHRACRTQPHNAHIRQGRARDQQQELPLSDRPAVVCRHAESPAEPCDRAMDQLAAPAQPLRSGNNCIQLLEGPPRRSSPVISGVPRWYSHSALARAVKAALTAAVAALSPSVGAPTKLSNPAGRSNSPAQLRCPFVSQRIPFSRTPTRPRRAAQCPTLECHPLRDGAVASERFTAARGRGRDATSHDNVSPLPAHTTAAITFVPHTSLSAHTQREMRASRGRQLQSRAR